MISPTTNMAINNKLISLDSYVSYAKFEVETNPFLFISELRVAQIFTYNVLHFMWFQFMTSTMVGAWVVPYNLAPSPNCIVDSHNISHMSNDAPNSKMSIMMLESMQQRVKGCNAFGQQPISYLASLYQVGRWCTLQVRATPRLTIEYVANNPKSSTNKYPNDKVCYLRQLLLSFAQSKPEFSLNMG